MNINMVSTLNLDKLYLACLVKQNDETMPPQSKIFNKRYTDLLNHIEISYDLSDISIYEAYLLKLFASKASEFTNRNYIYSSINVYGAPRKYLALLQSIEKDEKIKNSSKYDYKYEYGPAYFLRGNITITFTGPGLYPILGSDPSTFFISTSNGTCSTRDETKNRTIFKDKYRPEADPNVINVLKDIFINEFTKFATKEINEIDLYSDTAIFNNFSNHEDFCTIVALRNPYCEINFKDTNDWKKDISVYVNNAPDYIKEQHKTLTELEFEIYSSMYTFLDLYLRLPKSIFISRDDLKVPARTRDKFIPPMFEEYKTRLESRYTSLEEYIDGDELKDNHIVKASYTYFNSKIAYSIKLSLPEINIYINSLLKQHSGDLIKEEKTLLEKIIKFAVATHKLL